MGSVRGTEDEIVEVDDGVEKGPEDVVESEGPSSLSLYSSLVSWILRKTFVRSVPVLWDKVVG